MFVRDFMTQPVTVVDEDMALEAIAGLMLEKNIGCVPVGVILKLMLRRLRRAEDE